MTRYKLQVWIESDATAEGLLNGSPALEAVINGRITKQTIKEQKPKQVYVPKAKKGAEAQA